MLLGGDLSVEAVKWVLDHSVTESAADRLVLVILAEHANEAGEDAWPSTATIARRADVTRGQVFKSLARLRRSGLIEKVGEHRSRASIYRLLMVSQGDSIQNRPSPTDRLTLSRIDPDSIQNRPEPSLTTQEPPTHSAEVKVVYEHWRVALGKRDKRYETISAARKGKIVARLKEGFTPQQLCDVFDIAARDPWEERRKHNDIEVLLRNRGKVDWWLDQAHVNGNGHKPFPCHCGTGFLTAQRLAEHQSDVHGIERSYA